MNPPVYKTWDGTERRKPNSCRRQSERRSSRERRYDRREGSTKNRGFYGWIRSLLKARLGVDRRKNIDRRVVADRRSPTPRSMLTKEELADLLK